MSRRQQRTLSMAGTLVIAIAVGGCMIVPTELGEEQLATLASLKQAQVTADIEPIATTIDVYHAIARAVRYNLDHHVELAELALRDRELEMSHYSLLPGLVANSGYTGRNKVAASNSLNVLTGTESLATSTSQDKRISTADIGFSWNILDFGLSYVRAQQSADKVLVQNELRRKVMLRIIEETRSAFWRAVAAQRLFKRLSAIEAQARAVELDARRMAAGRETPIITALTYEREVVDVQRVLGELQRDLNAAHAQLAALMNVPPGTIFRVTADTASFRTLPDAGTATDLVHTALMRRPELREIEYRKRINQREATAALLELLPGVQMIAGANTDSNSFLLNQDWVSLGARASWNLIKVFSYPARREVIDQQDHLLQKRSLALTMAVMVQVHVGLVRFHHAKKDYDTAKRYRNVQSRLMAQIRAEADAGRVAKQSLVREELNALIADIKTDIARAALESAYATVLASVGVDPFGAEANTGQSVADMAASFRTAWHAHGSSLGGPLDLAQK